MSTISTVLGVLLSTIYLSAFPPSDGSALPPEPISIVAIAPDVHAFVMRDAGGNLHRLAEGAILGAWRVRRITADTVVLQSTHRLAGQVVEVRLGAGTSVDLNAEAAKIEKLRGAQWVPVQTRLVPDKSKSSASR